MYVKLHLDSHRDCIYYYKIIMMNEFNNLCSFLIQLKKAWREYVQSDLINLDFYKWKLGWITKTVYITFQHCGII